MNPRQALILHAWYSHPEDHWYPWLGDELTRHGYVVSIPELPTMDTDMPDMELQLKTINEVIKIDDQTLVVGHSLGCLLALRLAEHKAYSKMILVAGWDFDDLTEGHRLFWDTKLDHNKIRSNVQDIVCIHSDNDPYITACQAEEMSKRLGGQFILVQHAGHFTSKDGVTKIDELLALV
jgi:hypothetical protein